MNRYDCTKTMDFLHESARVCTYYDDCEACIRDTQCHCVGDPTSLEDIAYLQKWSDTHPEITRKQKFVAFMEENNIKYSLCNKRKMPMMNCKEEYSCDNCSYYWNDTI